MKRIVILFMAMVLILQVLLIPGFAADTDSGTGTVVQDLFSGYTVRALGENETVRYGIDVSQYQSSIDWETLADEGLDFAFIRIGYRSYGSGALHEDTRWAENVQNAEAAGLQVGVYIYSQAISEAEGREEADYVLSLLGDTQLSLPIVIDYEYADVYNSLTGRLYRAGLNRAEQTAVCSAFCSRIEAAGYDAAVYANEYMLSSRMNAEALGTVWISNVCSETAYSGDYDFWQCSYYGRLPGISGKVDLDIWLDDGSFGELKPDTDPVFSDMNKSDWSYEAIEFCVESSILEQNETEFRPAEAITRMDLITMLYRCSGAAAEAEETAADTDIETRAAAWVSSSGILKGNKQKLWTVQTVQRQEMVRMLYRLAGSPEPEADVLSSFADGAEAGGYYRDAMNWALKTGILCGDASGNLNPTGTVSRETAAVLLYRYCISAAQ